MFNSFKLKQEHPELFMRVVTKIIVHILLGLSLFYSPPIPTESAKTSVLLSLLSLRTFGFFFMVLGLFIGMGAYSSRNGNYQFLRITLGVASGNAMMWLLSLIFGLLVGSTRSAPTAVLWGFFTYKLFNLVNDPGFQTIKLEKIIDEHLESINQ